MADITWVGKQIARANVWTLVVGTADSGSTITITCGPSQSVVVTPTTNITATTATDIYNALQGVGGCFVDLTVSVSSSTVTFTGPSDGTPVTLSKTDAGGNVTTLTQTVTPKSPNDANDGINYSANNVPTGGDRLIFENSAVPVKWNLDAIAAITLAAGTGASAGLIRRATYTGAIGLPDTNAAGYPEYRTTQFSYDSPGLYWEAAKTDAAGQFRLKCTYTVALHQATVAGPGSNAQVGSEALELSNFPVGKANTLFVTGASVAFCPVQSQTGELSDFNALNSTIRIGVSATLSGTLEFDDCAVQIGSSWTTSLTQSGSSSAVEVIAAAAGVIVGEEGTMTWHSTGNPGASPVIGSGFTLDLDTAPAALTISGTVQMYAGGTLADVNGRGGNYALHENHCKSNEYTWTHSNKTLTLS